VPEEVAIKSTTSKSMAVLLSLIRRVAWKLTDRSSRRAIFRRNIAKYTQTHYALDQWPVANVLLYTACLCHWFPIKAASAHAAGKLCLVTKVTLHPFC